MSFTDEEKKKFATVCPKTCEHSAISNFGFSDVMELVTLAQKYGPALATLINNLINELNAPKKVAAAVCPGVSKFGIGDLLAISALVQKYGPQILILVESIYSEVAPATPATGS